MSAKAGDESAPIWTIAAPLVAVVVAATGGWTLAGGVFGGVGGVSLATTVFAGATFGGGGGATFGVGGAVLAVAGGVLALVWVAFCATTVGAGSAGRSGMAVTGGGGAGRATGRGWGCSGPLVKDGAGVFSPAGGTSVL